MSKQPTICRYCDGHGNSTAQASVVLHDAQKKLRDSGWIRGSLHTSPGGYCALGAIDAVRCGLLHEDQMQARRRLYETHLFRSPLSFVMGVDTWNDCPWRREATVLARFRKAEKHARRDEERNKLHPSTPKPTGTTRGAPSPNAEK